MLLYNNATIYNNATSTNPKIKTLIKQAFINYFKIF